MLEWLRRTFHLGPDHERVNRDRRLALETYRNVEALETAQSALHQEIRRHPNPSVVTRALLRARDGGVQRRGDEEWSHP